jgi:hypothetical protein
MSTTRGSAIYARAMDIAYDARRGGAQPENRLEDMAGDRAHSARKALERFRCHEGPVDEAVELLAMVGGLGEEQAAETLARYELGRG